MLVELLRRLIVEALDGGFFQRAIHPLDLAIGPRVSGLGQAMLDALFTANADKTVPTWQYLRRLFRELYTIIGQHLVHFVRQIVEHAPQKFGCYHPLSAGMEFGEGYFAGAVNGHKKILLAFLVVLLASAVQGSA